MNLPAANSGGFAGSPPPPPQIELFIVLPDGSCTPATRERCRIVMKQARDELRKQRKIKRHEKAVELQMKLEDRAAARSVLEELAELARGSRRWAARFKVQAEPKRPATRTSPVQKRLTATLIKAPRTPPGTLRPGSSWVVDAHGMRGIIWQQSYLGRKSPKFHRGAARDNWEYIVRDEAVLLDEAGEPIILSNMGEDWVEIGAAWQAMEDASTRKNAKIQILAIAPFDSDMSGDEMVAALRHFCTTVLEPLGVPYSAAIHAPPEHGDERNFHPHIAFGLRSMRRVGAYCWDVADEVCGELDGRDGVQTLRHLWAHSMSEAAAQARRTMAYTGLGYGARGLDHEAGTHLGEGRAAIVARGGYVWAHERNRLRNARNAARQRIRDLDQKIAALTKVRDAALARQARAEQSSAPVRGRLIMANPVQAPTQRSVARPVASATSRTASMPTASDRRSASRPTIAPSPIARSQPATALTEPQASRPMERPPAGVTRSASGPVDLPLVRTASASVGHAPTVRTASDQPQPITTLNAAPTAADAMIRPIARPPKVTSPALIASQLSTAAEGIGLRRPSGVKPSATRVAAAERPARPTDPVITRTEAVLAAIRLQKERSRKRGVAASADGADVLAPADAARSAERVPTEVSSPKPTRGAREPIRVGTPASIAVPTNQPLPSPAQQAAQWRAKRISADAGRRAPIGHLATRAWHEQHLQQAWSEQAARTAALDRRRLDHLALIDAYVADLRDGSVDIGSAAMKAAGVDADWVRRPHIQQELSAIRARQQVLVSTLAADAQRRPLAFARTGTRFWPHDLPPDDLARLDRWAVDPGFQDDVFAIERHVRAAHLAADAQASKRRESTQKARTAEAARLPGPVPDGFGGQRTTPAPAYEHREAGPRVHAFDPRTGKPSRSLLELLRFCGEHPHTLAFASDGKLMGLPGTPPLIDPLIRMWRHDGRVEALVVATASASRAAGRAVYPAEHAPAIRALTPTPPPRTPPDRGRSVGR